MAYSSLPKFDAAEFAWMSQISKRFSFSCFPVTAGMESTWETQTPPQFPPSLERDEDAEALYCWWIIDGIRQHAFVPFVFGQEHFKHLGRTVITPSGKQLPLWLYRYWQATLGLQQRFDLSKHDDVAALLIWWLTSSTMPTELIDGLPIPQEVIRFLHEPATGCALPIPFALKAIWLENVQGAQQLFDITQNTGCAALLIWFLLYGNDILPGFRVTADPALVDALLKHNENGIPLFAEAMQVVRPDALPYYPLDTPQGLEAFILWIVRHPCKDLLWWLTSSTMPTELIDDLPIPQEVIKFLHEPATGCALPIPFVLKAIWLGNVQGAQQLFDITQNTGCAALLIWFLLYGNDILPGFRVTADPALVDALLKHNENGIPLFAEAMQVVRPDALPYYPLDTPQGLEAFILWIAGNPCKDLLWQPLIHAVLAALAPTTLPEGRQSVLSTETEATPARHGNFNLVSHHLNTLFEKSQIKAAGGLATGGVNIVGFAKGELGLGEDVRMTVKACGANSIPFVVFDPPFAITSGQGDLTVKRFIKNKPQYGVNITFLPGIETLRLFFNNGPQLFNKRYNIGAWQWELPNWPRHLQHVLPLAQEFWSASRFIMETMQSVSEVSVFHMPMAVELPPFKKLDRTGHGLPENEFLFLYVFDGLSWGARKNPMAAIRAFHDAFPFCKDVRLVIKTMNATSSMPFWHAVLEEAEKDGRILCINEIYTKSQLLSLFACCDAYVSLHRSEGFGRTIAEAMLLEKPVIATAWSGNADFTTEETAFAIGGKLVPLKKDEYLFWEGQHWCEPDHDQAVAAMRQCRANTALVKRKAVAGRQLITTHYSAASVGERYRVRLEELGVL